MNASARRALLRLLQDAAALPHSGRSFVEHLIGTYRVLVAWKQPEPLCLAGLLHSAYATESYPHAIVPIGNRRSVRAIAGPAAERLIHAFCTIDRRALWELQTARSPHTQRSLRVPTHRGAFTVLRAHEAQALVLLECANLAEQAHATDRGPAPWMAKVLAGWRGLLNGPTAVTFTTASEANAIAEYRRAQSHARARAAAAALERTSALNPWAGEPYILRALLASGAEAKRHASRGARLLATWGIAWDRRLTLRRWRTLAIRAGKGQRGGDFYQVVSELECSGAGERSG